MYDIVFCSIPYSSLDHIYSAPAILKGVVQNHGYSAKTVEFGCDLLKLCDNSSDLFYQVQNYFITAGKSDKSIESEIIDVFYDHVIDFLRKHPAHYIGISVFSVYTHKATVEILYRLKKENIQSKIVIGGRGANIPIFKEVFKDEFVPELTKTEKFITFGELLKKRNLADFIIAGDGEDAIVDLLENKVLKDAEFNNSEMFKTPTPDYEDYNFNNYLFPDGLINLPVTGSKGCVRDCDFCDVKFAFGRYRYRNGKDIANEIIQLSNRYNVRKFQFTDSLVNGSLKVFREFVEIISQYNKDNPDKKVTWNGQYICRPADQMPQDLYKLMAEAGAEGMTIGAESGSNNVLLAMNKKTTVEALYYELEQFRKHNITCTLLTFTGHWSETWADFVQHCKMFVRITPYVRSGTISSIFLGYPMAMLDGTPARENADEKGIILSEFAPKFIWRVANNPGNTFKERVYRRLLLVKLLQKLKIPTIFNLETLSMVNKMIDNHEQEINQFYELSS